MTTLNRRDVAGILDFVGCAQEIGGDEPFSPAVLAELGKLVAADWITYCELDRVRMAERCCILRDGDDEVADPEAPYWEIAGEHPVCSRHDAGEFGALKLSDFVTLSALRRSRVYSLWFKPYGVDHELNVAIPSPPWHTKTFLFDRAPGRDFGERDRLVLDALQPHLARLWRAAQTRRRLQSALAALERVTEEDGRGVLILGADGRVDWASPRARRLVDTYFGPFRDRVLPPALADWVDSDSATVTRTRGSSSLTVDRSRDALLLTETTDEVGLTPRERQILAWVARGKTNPQIAELLWIAPSTVAKHLENVYAKLDVRTRTAAAARFLGLLDAEDALERA